MQLLFLQELVFINTQNAKADTTLTPNKGITLKTSELKTTKVIKAPSDGSNIR